jgi:hypothetical protein
MSKGVSLHIGLNSVDPKHYGGWSGDLAACEADASDMADIAAAKKFKARTLLTKAGTRKNVTTAIESAARSLQKGDMFFLTYSGHGGQLPDINADEPDRQDETWCLYDAELVDDEIFALLGKFAKGVRILVLSDSCHSGSVIKAAFYQGTVGARAATLGPQPPRYRFMPPDVALRTYRNNRKFYDPILSNRKLAKAQAAVKASALLISGCQDNQFSSDGVANGLFTGTLLAVWGNGRFTKGYTDFHKAILRRMPPDQTPNLFRVGASNPAFEAQAPFTL